MYLMIAVDARGREWTTSYTSSDPEAAEQLAREHTQMSQHSWSLVGHPELAWTYIVREKNERAATHIDVPQRGEGHDQTAEESHSQEVT